MRRAIGILILCLVVAGSCAHGDDDTRTLAPTTTRPVDPMLTCGYEPFPASALSNPPGAENDDTPAAQAFRELRQRSTPIPELPRSGYRLLSESDTDAQFAARLGDEWEHDLWIVHLVASNGVWDFRNGGECTPRTLRDGVESAQWELTSGQSLEPDAAEVHIGVWERACTSGASLAGRIQEPDIEYRTHRVIITLYVTPLDPPDDGPGSIDVYTCIGPPSTPHTVTLAEPLGDRQLLDGGSYPPRPPEPL